MMPSPSTVSAALRHVFDPELGIDVVSLGLVYAIECGPRFISVAMTTTSDSCPMGPAILQDALTVLRRSFPSSEIHVEFAELPPWHPEMLSASAREVLGLPAVP